MKSLLSDMEALVADVAGAGAELEPIGRGLGNGVDALRQASDWLLGRVATEPNDALAGATPYLEVFGLVIGGWLLARSALAARRLLGAGDADPAGFLAEKVATACFYCQQLLPQAGGLLPAIMGGAAALYAVGLQSAHLG